MTDNASGPRDPGLAGSQPQTRLLHFTDTIVAAIILIAATILYYITTTFDSVSAMLSQNIGPALFPRLLLVFIVVLTLVIPIEHLFVEGGAKRLDKERSNAVRPRTWYMMCLMIAIVAVAPYLGIVLTLVAICITMPVLWGETRIRVIAPFAIGFPAAIYVLFAILLKVPLAPGLLAFLE